MLALLFEKIKHRMPVYRVELYEHAVQLQKYRQNYLDSGRESVLVGGGSSLLVAAAGKR